MNAHNPRKRRAEEELVPAHSPKLPRTSPLSGELSARWIRVSKDAMELFRDTGSAIFGALSNVVNYALGSDREQLPITQPQRRPQYPISPPPSPSKSGIVQPSSPSPPGALEAGPSRRSGYPPSPPLSVSSSEESNPAELVPSNSSKPPARSQLPPPPRRQPANQVASTSKLPPPQARRPAQRDDVPDPPLPTPPPSDASGTTASPSTNFLGLHPQLEQALTAAIHRPSKPKETRKVKHRVHIFHNQFKAGVKDQLKKTREDMERDLYLLRRRTVGFQSSLKEFRGWLGYRERLEVLQKLETLAPSPSLEDLRDTDLYPPLHRSQSNPVASTTYIQRALRDAEKSLFTPKPVVYTPSLSRLRATQEELSAQIDARIRPKRPSLPDSLPPEDEAEVDALFRKRGVISKCVREQVSDKDLSRLRPAQWLNDEIINFYGQMIMNRADEGKENRDGVWDAHYFSTFFWTKLKNEGYEKGRLAKWTKKFDLFSKDIILIPVNHNNSHWTAAAINFKKKRIESYDSMGMERGMVYKLLRAYLDAEHRNKKKKPFDFTGWVDWVLEDTPQQENGYDCGVFTCQFLESLARGEENFALTQSNMNYLRRKMVWEIGRARLRSNT